LLLQGLIYQREGKKLIEKHGIDLLIGGSPCKEISGYTFTFQPMNVGFVAVVL
jgi:hypothetical protein